jgi:hypothetical protein
MSRGTTAQTVATRPRSPTLRALDEIGVAVALLASVGVGIWLQLTYYTVQRFAQPVGADTPTYLWRSRLAIARGLNAIPGSSPFEFHANSANPDRLGLPALAAVLNGVVHIDPNRLMFVLPAICAATLGFATWILARAAGEPRWGACVWGVAGAASVALAVTARGYFDNVLIDPLLVGATAMVLLSIDASTHRGDAAARICGAAVLLLSAAILVHFIIVGFMVVVFALFGAMLLPSSRRAWRSGESIWTTPAGRVGSIFGASALIGGAGLLATSGSNVFQNQGRASYAKTLGSQLPLYRLPVTGSIAAVGAIGLAAQGGGRRVRALTLFAIWGGLIAIAGIAYATGMSIPVQRFLGMALPLTFVGAAALTWVVKLAVSPTGWPRWALGTAAWTMIVASLGGFVWMGDRALSGVVPMWSPAEQQIWQTASDYLQDVHASAPVILVVHRLEPETDYGMILAYRRLRAAVPGAITPNAVVYLGDPKNLLAGRPTYVPGRTAFNATSKLYWDRLGPYLRPDAIVLVNADYDVDYASLEKRYPELSPGLLLIRGPNPSTGVQQAPLSTTPSARSLALWTLLPLLLLLGCGIGWSVSLVPLGWAERAAMAPVLGLASVIIVADLSGVVGVPMHGGWPVAMAVIAAIGGWVPTISRRFGGPGEESRAQDAPEGGAGTGDDDAAPASDDVSPGVLGS